MADRTPEGIKESFKTFRPGPISEAPVRGIWLSVRTDTPGRHRFTNEQTSPGPSPTYSDGMFVRLQGPGTVTFKLNDPAETVYFSIWSPSGNGGTVRARYIAPEGGAHAEIDHPLLQTGGIAMYTGPGMIAAVDISITASSPDIVCVDNFSSFDEGEWESLRALNKAELTMDDILNLRRQR